MLNSISQYSAADELKAPDFLVKSSSDGASVQLLQPVSAMKHEKADLSVFFGVGMVVNIVMIVTFFVWAVKQWKKNDTTKK